MTVWNHFLIFLPSKCKTHFSINQCVVLPWYAFSPPPFTHSSLFPFWSPLPSSPTPTPGLFPVQNRFSFLPFLFLLQWMEPSTSYLLATLVGPILFFCLELFVTGLSLYKLSLPNSMVDIYLLLWCLLALGWTPVDTTTSCMWNDAVSSYNRIHLPVWLNSSLDVFLFLILTVLKSVVQRVVNCAVYGTIREYTCLAEMFFSCNVFCL